jgi:hypothetical protein
MDICLTISNHPKNCFQIALPKAKTDMHEELRSSPQPDWSRRLLRSRAYLQTASCPSSHLDFLKL